MTTRRPSSMRLADAGALEITWDDGQASRLMPGILRKACPCATCREKHSAAEKKPNLLPVLKMEETKPLAIAGMRPVGNYAYNVQFSDGHRSGLFTIELLDKLSTPIS